jgi:hypothetical protein
MALPSTDERVVIRWWIEESNYGYEFTLPDGRKTTGVFAGTKSIDELGTNLRSMGYDVTLERGQWERTWVPNEQ